jgi:hypothetical protein
MHIGCTVTMFVCCMNTGWTIEEIKNAGNKIIDGSWPDATEMKTMYGKRTLNFWRKLPDGSWENYDMKTIEIEEDYLKGYQKFVKEENRRRLTDALKGSRNNS